MASMKCSNEQMVELELMLEKLMTQPVEARTWESVDAALKACAPLMWIMRNFSDCIDFNKIETLNGAGAVRRFYNEAIAFIEGKPRTISAVAWLGIINDICRTGDYNGGSAGNIGTTLTFRPSYVTPINTVGIASRGLSLNLQSYAPHETMTSWILRENGINDMIITLRCASLIFMNFNTIK